MYWTNYLSYFFYLGINWNFRLAGFILAREIKGEKKYKLRTTGFDNLRSSVSEKDRKHASIYQPLNFYTAEKLFDQLTADDLKGCLLDVGCGKGRILAIAAYYGIKQVIGIDFSPSLCHDAVDNANIIESNFPETSITIECEDARFYEIPIDVTILFMFNPFDDLVMMDFIQQIKKSLALKPRFLKILYANPQCKKHLIDAGFEEISHFKKIEYLQGSVLTLHP